MITNNNSRAAQQIATIVNQVFFGRLTNIIPQKPSMLFECYSRLLSTYISKHFCKSNIYSVNLHSPVKQAIVQSILNKGE